ncbi:hypothetical protein B0H16DRAFT_1587236 [Mycena metata]|uniref:Uncharacterized protein n=1 Tax=Mycena metata TaxID=1033252 RepID=A0AAD7DSA9_9AGAR|nr:hypothetical protein B0H16DRAFT_1903708 [Mycena metata]KAJ7729359.1 hypothetical protein B0H16DRAFT_1587236 [Mycena metata]
MSHTETTEDIMALAQQACTQLNDSRADVQLLLIAVPAPANRPLAFQDFPASPSSSSESEDEEDQEQDSNTSQSSSSSVYDADDDDSPPAPPPSVASSRSNRAFPFKKLRGLLTVFFAFLLLLLNQALMIAFLHIHLPVPQTPAVQIPVPGGFPATPPFGIGGPQTFVVVVLCRKDGGY